MGRTAILFACLLGSLAASSAAPAAFIDANKEEFVLVNKLIAKAGLEDLFNDESLAYTFFLPLDHAFGWFKEYLPTLESTTTSDIAKAIDTAEIEQVQKFLKQHIVSKPLRTVDEVVSTEDFDSIADVSLSANGDDNYVSVMEVDGFSGSVAGPMVIPAGKSYIYVIYDGLLADPAMIVGHGPIDDGDVDDEDEFDVIFEGDSTEGVASAPSPDVDGARAEL